MIAYLTQSILPALPVHIAADLAFFTLVWPHDAARRLIWETGPDGWFWVHTVQAVVFTVFAVVAFVQLAKVTRRGEGSTDIL